MSTVEIMYSHIISHGNFNFYQKFHEKTINSHTVRTKVEDNRTTKIRMNSRLLCTSFSFSTRCENRMFKVSHLCFFSIFSNLNHHTTISQGNNVMENIVTHTLDFKQDGIFSAFNCLTIDAYSKIYLLGKTQSPSDIISKFGFCAIFSNLLLPLVKHI